MLISAIIPTYNRAATIGDAVTSVLEQTYSDLEVIIVDDGSSDSTDAVLAKFGDAIRVVKQANAGPSAARNHGVQISRGEIVSFQHKKACDCQQVQERAAHRMQQMKRADGLYNRGRRSQPVTCLVFGKHRKEEFPDYFFCNGCDLLEDAIH